MTMSAQKTYGLVTFWLFTFTALELFIYPLTALGSARTAWLLTFMATKALIVALVYMNLRREGWALKLAFIAPVPVAIYFLLFLMYDAAYVWKS